LERKESYVRFLRAFCSSYYSLEKGTDEFLDENYYARMEIAIYAPKRVLLALSDLSLSCNDKNLHGEIRKNFTRLLKEMRLDQLNEPEVSELADIIKNVQPM